jgi:predicted TIM-barrel fold metal-dependent hydrolase
MIDAHVHIVSPNGSRYPKASDDAGAHYDSTPVSAETLLELIDSQAVQKVVLVQAFAAYRYDNRYVADSARAHPERLAFVSGVDPLSDDARDAARHWAALGSRGLRAIALTPDFDPSRLDSLFEVAAEHGICVCLLASPVVLRQLGPLLLEFPAVPLVLDHCGLQALASAPEDLGAPDLFALARFDNIRLKVSTRVFNQVDGDPSLALQKLVERFGSERVLWGSDYPASAGPTPEASPSATEAYASTIRAAHALTARLSATDCQQVLHATSDKLWR